MLVDPWLVGELVFAGQRWAYHGEKSEPKVKNLDPVAIAGRAAFILLSQVHFNKGCPGVLAHALP